MATRQLAAIDLGASSGRVMLATCTRQTSEITLTEIHRFNHPLLQRQGHYCWDLDFIEAEIQIGLQKILQRGIELDSIGIDTWGVDYVLLDAQGQRVGPSYAYRDHRTDGVMEKVIADLGQAAIYQQTGIQFLPFNTLYQLKALLADNPPWLAQVAHLQLLPDYLSYRLTGQLNWEYTNATTTQLVNLHHENWEQSLLNYLGVPKNWLGDITHAGRITGYWQTGAKAIPVVAVASHDTASAVIAAPMLEKGAAYLSSGTWSLMGLESPTPCVDEFAMQHNITNEGGIAGRYRVLKNIMGLWLLQRICQEQQVSDLSALLQEVAQLEPFTSLINPNAVCFIHPESMTQTIGDYCRQHQQPVPQTTAELVRTVLDSLALLYRQVARELSTVQGRALSTIHIVGGGCQNNLLNQLCANLCEVPVTAGPIEASSLGNIGCQLLALDEASSLKEIRHWILQSFPLQTYQPQPLPQLDAVWQRFLQLTQ